MKKYKWKVEEIENKIKLEIETQEDLEKQKKKLKDKIYFLENALKKVENKISEIEYKIYKNNKYLQNFKNKINRLSSLAFPTSMLVFLGPLLMFGGYNAILNLATLGTATGASITSTYAVRSILNNAYYKKEKENEEFNSLLKELIKEKTTLTSQISFSKTELKKCGQEIEESKHKTKDLEKKLEQMVNIWNDEIDKKMEQPENKEDEKLEKSKEEVKEYVLKKQKPKDLYEEFEEERKAA